jgi:hypothetical protein
LRKHGTDAIDLVLVDRMSHSGIGAEINVRSHPLEDAGGLTDKIVRYPRVDVAAADENRHPVERAGIIPGHAPRPDQRAAEDEQPSILPGIASDILGCQAGALGKAPKKDLLARKSLVCASFTSPSTVSNAEDRSGSFASSGPKAVFGYQRFSAAPGTIKLTPSICSAWASGSIDSASRRARGAG